MTLIEFLEYFELILAKISWFYIRFLLLIVFPYGVAVLATLSLCHWYWIWFGRAQYRQFVAIATFRRVVVLTTARYYRRWVWHIGFCITQFFKARYTQYVKLPVIFFVCNQKFGMYHFFLHRTQLCDLFISPKIVPVRDLVFLIWGNTKNQISQFLRKKRESEALYPELTTREAPVFLSAGKIRERASQAVTAFFRPYLFRMEAIKQNVKDYFLNQFNILFYWTGYKMLYFFKIIGYVIQNGYFITVLLIRFGWLLLLIIFRIFNGTLRIVKTIFHISTRFCKMIFRGFIHLAFDAETRQSSWIAYKMYHDKFYATVNPVIWQIKKFCLPYIKVVKKVLTLIFLPIWLRIPFYLQTIGLAKVRRCVEGWGFLLPIVFFDQWQQAYYGSKIYYEVVLMDDLPREIRELIETIKEPYRNLYIKITTEEVAQLMFLYFCLFIVTLVYFFNFKLFAFVAYLLRASGFYDVVNLTIGISCFVLTYYYIKDERSFAVDVPIDYYPSEEEVSARYWAVYEYYVAEPILAEYAQSPTDTQSADFEYYRKLDLDTDTIFDDCDQFGLSHPYIHCWENEEIGDDSESDWERSFKRFKRFSIYDVDKYYDQYLINDMFEEEDQEASGAETFSESDDETVRDFDDIGHENLWSIDETERYAWPVDVPVLRADKDKLFFLSPAVNKSDSWIGARINRHDFKPAKSWISKQQINNVLEFLSARQKLVNKKWNQILALVEFKFPRSNND